MIKNQETQNRKENKKNSQLKAEQTKIHMTDQI